MNEYLGVSTSELRHCAWALLPYGQLEAGLPQPRRATLVVVRRTLEAAGIEFIDENGGGTGVRFREPWRNRGRR
jgi:hypothetical protein